MKLSSTQKQILLYMSDGWSLCKSQTFDGRSWLQKNGCGRGGETKRVSSATQYALWKKGLITSVKKQFPTSTYLLTSKAIQLLKDEVKS